MAAHLIGYVGEASEDQMQSDSVTTGSIVGQFGVERVYNKLLMGEDGARRVVVNSIGREIRTLEEVPPMQGRRVQLTINYAMQKAAEDAFRAYGYFGSAVVLEPKTGEVLTLTSMPAFDPNDFATGIDRATWASLNTDKLRPLQNRAIQGRYQPGIDLQDRGRDRRARRRADHAGATGLLPGRRHVLRPLLQVPSRRRPRLRRSAPRDREVLQHLLLHGRQHARRRQDVQVVREARPRAEERHRPAERSREHRALDRVEAEALQRALVSGRDDFGRDRPGPVVGHADVDGGDDGDRRQRRHARRAAPREGLRRRQGLGAGRRSRRRRSCRS